MKKVLIFSSLCKPKSILELTLNSWLQQKTNCQVDFLFYDDNDSEESSLYLHHISKNFDNVEVESGWISDKSPYKDHYWNHKTVERLGEIKNIALERTLEGNYDGVFLVDGDLVLHNKTLNHLIGLNKEFVFEIFWTVFFDMTFAKPNCWDFHGWNYRDPSTILQLKNAGTYKVGAGGACTLLSTSAIKKGVTFTKIENAGFFGEDRHICTRAEVLGVDIYIDTTFPTYHIFELKMLEEAKSWFENGCKPSFFDEWLDEKWETEVQKMFIDPIKLKPTTIYGKYKLGLYKAKREFLRIITDK